MKVALTGAHGVGKTTLSELLANQLTHKGISVVTTPEVPRIICDLAHDPTFFRRGKNTALKQMLILHYQTHIEAHDSSEDDSMVVCDRALLDHWAYTKHFFEGVFREEGLINLYEQFVADYCRTYRMLFYVPIEFLPIDDGVRESDVEFQKSIDILIQQFLRQHNLPYMMVHGTPQERCDQIIQVLMVN